MTETDSTTIVLITFVLVLAYYIVTHPRQWRGGDDCHEEFTGSKKKGKSKKHGSHIHVAHQRTRRGHGRKGTHHKTQSHGHKGTHHKTQSYHGHESPIKAHNDEEHYTAFM
jgi:hypothetical protein